MSALAYLKSRGVDTTRYEGEGWGPEARRIGRLKYILEHTFNAGSAFEFRRHEIGLLRSAKGNARPASDIEVAESFYDAIIKPSGVYRRYLSNAQLAACAGSTLFVHGAVTAAAAGFVPAASTRAGAFEIEGQSTKASATVQDWSVWWGSWDVG